MTKQEIEDFKEAYDSVWRYVEGLEGPSGPRDLLKRLGCVGPYVEKAAEKATLGSDGVDFPELIRLINNHFQEQLDMTTWGDSAESQAIKSELLEAFEVFDKHSKGLVDAKEFSRCMRETTHFSEEEIQALVDAATTTKSGSKRTSKLDYKNFLKRFLP